jgi:glycosyltransferase involved in cell wall biosynthesis
MKILHIHQDFPDGRNFPSTDAVKNLIKSVKKKDKEIKHFVLSINRTSNPFKVSFKRFDYGLSIVFWSIPLPFIYTLSIKFWVFILKKNINISDFDYIHAHKFTSEGFFAYLLSKDTSIPYYVSVRGGTDVHNIKRFPKLKKLYSNIYKNAKGVFWVSPWAAKFIVSSLDVYKKGVLLPNICNLIEPKSIINYDKSRYTTVLSFHQYRRKGLLQLFESIYELNKRGFSIKLDVIGSGGKKEKQIIQNEICKLGLSNNIKLLGQLPHSEVLTNLQSSKALLLPAENETFGMAYVEAISCGCPILYMANTGIDGYFCNKNVGIKVHSQEVVELSEAIIKLENNNLFYNEEIHNFLKRDELKYFAEDNITKTYIMELANDK